MCEGAFDALALRAAGVPRVVAIFGVQGWRWARAVREFVFALDADAAGQLLSILLPPPTAWASVLRMNCEREGSIVGQGKTPSSSNHHLSSRGE